MNVPQKRHQQALLLRLSRSLSLSLNRPVPTFPMQIHMCTHIYKNIHDTDRLSQSALSLCSRSSVLVRLSLSWTHLLFCSSVGFHVAPFVKTNFNLLYAQTWVSVCKCRLHRVLLVYFLTLLNYCYLCIWINLVTFLRVIGVWADHNISTQAYEHTNISLVFYRKFT